MPDWAPPSVHRTDLWCSVCVSPPPDLNLRTTWRFTKAAWESHLDWLSPAWWCRRCWWRWWWWWWPRLHPLAGALKRCWCRCRPPQPSLSHPLESLAGIHSPSPFRIFSGGSSDFFAFFDKDHDHDHDHDNDDNNDDGQNHYVDETRQSKSPSLPHVISRPTRP